jgi:translocation and assembly module TamB
LTLYRTRRVLRWFAGGVAALLLLVLLAAAGLWWWAGQEGSLEWALRRAAQGQPLESEGVQGSLRSGWHIKRLAWERDGLRLEAQDIRLEWQPVALLTRTLRLDQVSVGSVRVIDKRPASSEAWKPPATLGLPWRVVVDEVTVGKLAWRGRMQADAAGLAGSYSFDGLHHRWNLKSLQLAGGSYRGQGTLAALAPMTLDARLAGTFPTQVPGVAQPVPLQFEARLQGPLAQLEARAQLRVAAGGAASPSTSAHLPSATATARITPFEPMPVPRGAATFRQLDLAQFWPTAPRTLLSGHVEVEPAGAQHWQLQANVRNALPGPWDAQRLPLVTAQGVGEWRGGTALVKQLHAQLAGGTVEGSGAWQGEGWRFDGRVDGVDPAGLHGSLASLPLTGPIQLAGAGPAVDFDVALHAGGRTSAAPRKPAAGTDNALRAAVGALEVREAVAKGRFNGDALALSSLRVRTSDAVLEGQLQLQLAAGSGSGKLQLRAPGLQGQASGSLAQTRGNGVLELTASDLAQAQQWLKRWPGSSSVLPGGQLRGRANARLAWQGGWHDPSVQGRVQGTGVQWVPAGADPKAPPWQLRTAQLQWNGRLRDAALDLRAQAQRGQRQLELAAAGRVGGALGAAAPDWHGQLARLDVQVQDPGITPGPWQLQLRRPVDWRLAGSAFELSAGEAVLRAPAMRSGAPATEAVLAWAPVRRQGGELTTSGRLSGLPLAWLELVGGSQLAGSALSGDMVFDAQWNAQLGRSVRVDASLARVRGDVMVLAESADGAAARVSAGVRDARLTVSSQGEQLTLALLWDSERAGHAQGQVRTRLARGTDGGWSWPQQAPLAGRIQAQLPRIGVWSLLAPPGWRLRGSLSADIAVGGTLAQPQLSGPLTADDLALRSVVDGIELRNGRLRAQLAGQRLVVSEFLLHGSEEAGLDGGTLVASGEGAWLSGGPQLQVSAQLTRLRASIRSDRQLTVSGPVTARMDRAGTRVEGRLVIDRARIHIPDETAPQLGDDVLVRNAPGLGSTEGERALRPAPTAAGRTVTLAISFDLGPDFRVSGRGLDTRLAGALEVAGRSLGVPQMTGLVRTVGGTYEAYGQRMTIERGVLRFTGAADNPALDILAIRPNLTQRVGVLVSGRAQAPHVELYSDGGLSEAETLSWLVLGRSSSGGGAETALLQRAATALLSGRRGTGKGLAGSFGLDEVSVRPDSGTAFVRVGKRFADNFYAAYERSLAGAMGTLYIFYDVSRRLTVRAEAGERTGVDLIFTFAFDRGGKK